MRLPWSQRKKDADEQSERIEALRADAETRLEEAKRTRERLEPKIAYQERRRRVNAVYEEAAYVLSRGRTA